MKSFGAVCAAFAVAGCGGAHSKPGDTSPSTAVAAKVLTATMSNAPAVRDAVGTVRSATTSAIQSKTVGHVTAVPVKAGDTVAAGAVLVEIDSRDADAQFKAATSGLQVAERMLDEAVKGLAAAQSGATAAEAQRDLAKTTFERQSKLLAQKAISKQVYDEADAAAKSAEAQARMRADEVAAAQAKRDQAAAAVEQAQAALDAAKTGLSYTKVTAPFAGIVASKSVDVGDLASPGMTLLTLEDRSAYRLEASVDESTASGIRVNDSIGVAIDGVGGGPMTGTVNEIVPAADPSSRTLTVKIALPPNELLRSGQFGRARFSSGETTSIAVPRSAIVVRGQLEGVFAVDTDGTAHLRLIKTGDAVGDGAVEVLSGLNAGDRYVAEVTPEMADGVRVTAQ